MVELPLAERELTRSARRRSTYLLRLAPVALTCAVLAGTWLVVLASGTSIERGAGTMAAFLANMARVFEYFAVFAVGPLLTAGLIAQEKQERTLSLLLMADFRGWDVYLAKFVSAFLQVELLILSMLPLLAIASFLGGVSVPEAAVQIFLLSVTALATCSLGLLCSTVCRRPIDAFLLTLGLLFGWMGLSAAGGALFGAYLDGSLNIAETAWSPSNTPWAASAAFTALLAAGASLAAIKLLPRQAHEGAKRPRPARRGQPRVTVPFVRRRRNAEPIAELLFAGGERMFGGSQSVRVLLAVLLAVLGYTCGGLVIVIAALYDITSSLAATRQNAVMDDLMTTPIEGEEFARSLLRAQRIRCRLYLPAVIMSMLRGFGMRNGLMAFGAMESMPLLIVGLLAVLILILNAGVIAPFLWRFVVALGCKASTWKQGLAGQTVLGVIVYGLLHIVFGILGIPSVLAFIMLSGNGPLKVPAWGTASLFILGVLATTALYAAAYWGIAAGWEREFVRSTSAAFRGQRPQPGNDRLGKAIYYP